jgi:glutamate synthase domain-containing protein 2
MKVPSFGALSAETYKGWALAAKHLGTFLAVPADIAGVPDLRSFDSWLMPNDGLEDLGREVVSSDWRLLEIPWTEKWEEAFERLKNSNPSALFCVKISMREGMEAKALSLLRKGITIIHLEGSKTGRFLDDEDRYLKDGIRSLHEALVEAGIRDEVTVLASGGLAMAEHVAKSLICGADAVFVDFPVLIALECRVCRRCTRGLSCPVDVEKASSGWVASRVLNLFGSWHNQLLEIMGAMGIRDARRLRGEAGRAMAFEELERSTFESMGTVEEMCELE